MVLVLNQDFGDVSKSQLCVPDDNLEDLEFFPNFADGLIHLTGLHEHEFFEDEDLRKFTFDVALEPEPLVSHASFQGELFDEKKHSQDSFEGEKKLRIEQDIEHGTRREMEARKKKSSFSGLLSLKKRICSHCEADKTPQWRAGPNGPRTLCNACGVRYKSGRLLPEYRPAACPNFDSRKHSNFHRKIVEKNLHKQYVLDRD